jgi:hypothetical protein
MHNPLKPGDPCGNGQKCNAAISRLRRDDSGQCNARDVRCGEKPSLPFTCS